MALNMGIVQKVFDFLCFGPWPVYHWSPSNQRIQYRYALDSIFAATKNLILSMLTLFYPHLFHLLGPHQNPSRNWASFISCENESPIVRMINQTLQESATGSTKKIGRNVTFVLYPALWIRIRCIWNIFCGLKSRAAVLFEYFGKNRPKYIK